MNQKRKYLFHLVFVLVALGTGFFIECNSSDNHQKKGSEYHNRYFPVKEGLEWQYVNQAPREETELYTVTVQSSENKAESIEALLSSFPFFNKLNNPAKLKISKKGEIYVIDSTGAELLFMPEEQKLTKEQTWQYGYWSAFVGDTNVTVKTDSGESFDCTYINYTLGGFTFSVELWLAKDKGIVKWGSNRTNPPSRSITYYVLK